MGIIKYRLDSSSEWVEIPALQGAQGLQGEKGEDGKDGYTPVKGVDYFTEEDIAEIRAGLDVDVDLSDYATIEAINEALENYAELSDLPNMEDYYRKEEVDGFLRVKANANHSHSNYLTETQVQALIDASLGVIENGAY